MVVDFNLMLWMGAKEKRFFKKKPKALANKKYHTSGYKRLSFSWVPRYSSINHS